GVQSQFGYWPTSITGLGVIAFPNDGRFFGCDPYSKSNAQEMDGKILVISRGECTFYRKAVHAQEAGAKAIIFINNE
ncbi:uncharacterized protein BYT42DRAFT_474111, partial [Radiomyces spectabilis]|uniref:uncharacterized protein n=1 Tax=Radiomyces spectabilis TaxID=64574 RepID=UPI002220766F